MLPETKTQVINAMMRTAWQIGVFYSKKYHRPRDHMISQAMYGLVEGVSRCIDKPVAYILAYIHGYCKRRFFWSYENLDAVNDQVISHDVAANMDINLLLSKLNNKELNTVNALLDADGCVDDAAKSLGVTRVTVWNHKQRIMEKLKA